MATLHLQMTVEYARGWIKRDIREGRYPRILEAIRRVLGVD